MVRRETSERLSRTTRRIQRSCSFAKRDFEPASVGMDASFGEGEGVLVASRTAAIRAWSKTAGAECGEGGEL